jgi:hypothetical protein
MLVLIGGIISLVSSAVTSYLQQRWERQKLDIQSRQHFTQVVYAKQTEFFDKLYPILGKLNGYITSIDVYLTEKSRNEKTESQRPAINKSAVIDFNGMVEQYYAYLPMGLLEEASELFSQCMLLEISPNKKNTEECVERLLRFQNVMREFAGIDKLSTDLMKAFGKES